MEREVVLNGKYIHFKGHKYEVIALAKDSNDLSSVVVYKNVDTNEIWTRNKDDFLSEVDHIKYPNVKQKYRFELIEEESN